MLQKQDLNQVQDLIASFRPKMSYFEEKILVPNIRDRLAYVISIFEDFKRIGKEEGVALHIDAALRNVVNPQKINMKFPEPKVGDQYLAAVGRICDEEYIKPITEILNRFTLNETVRSIDTTTEFLNIACNMFQTIVGTKDRPFSYTLSAFVNIKHTPTGQILLGPPQELTLILMPFQTRLNELVSVAESSIESIQLWARQINEQKVKHVEIIAYASQVKAAEEQARAAKYNMYFQVAVIVFTIILVVGAEKAGLYLEKRELEAALTKTELRARGCDEFRTSLESKVGQLENALNDMRARTRLPSTPLTKKLNAVH